MKNALGLIFGNIHEKEIPEITAYRTLGSVPFGGRYRLVDFVLSNMANSGIKKVGIITKTNYQSLMRHVGSGKQWDMSRKNGGLMVLPPFGTADSHGTYSSRFEALSNNLNYIRQTDEEYVIMSDCDTVCNFDFDNAMLAHKLSQADITVIYRKKNLDESDKKLRTIINLKEYGYVSSIEHTDKHSGLKNVYTNMMIIGRAFLLNLMSEPLRDAKRSFTQDFLVKGAKKYKIFGYELKGYFASIDSIPNYYKHSLELLSKENRDRLFDNNGAKIFTKNHDSAPCKFLTDSVINNSLIADGCVIEGEVQNSILFRGVKVEKGAKVYNSILFQNTVIGAGSLINCVITDKDCTVLGGRTLSGHETHPYYIAKGSTI